MTRRDIPSPPDRFQFERYRRSRIRSFMGHCSTVVRSTCFVERSFVNPAESGTKFAALNGTFHDVAVLVLAYFPGVAKTNIAMNARLMKYIASTRPTVMRNGANSRERASG